MFKSLCYDKRQKLIFLVYICIMKKENARRFSPTELNSEVTFGTFYNAYYQRFVKYAYYYVNDLPTAEDMTHDALLYYWENRRKLATDTDLYDWEITTPYRNVGR